MLVFPGDLFPAGHGPLVLDTTASLADGLGLGDTISTDIILVLADTIYMALQDSPTAEMNVTLEDVIELLESLQGIVQFNLADNIFLADDVDAILHFVATLSDALTFGLTASEQAAFTYVLLSSLVLGDAAQMAWFGGMTDDMAVADALSAMLQVLMTLVDDLKLSDDMNNTLVMTAFIADGIGYATSLSPSAVFNASLLDNVFLGGQITLDNVAYDAWVLNPQAGFTKYINYPFNSFEAVGGEAYAAGELGIYKLGADNDAGTDISAKFRSGLMDFGSSFLKNVPQMYFGMSSGGDFYVRTIVTEGGQKRTDVYKLTPKTGEVAFTAQKDLTNAIQQRYWQFEVENIDGEKLAIDEITWRLLVTKKHVGGGGSDG